MKDSFQTKKRDEQSHLWLCSIVVVGIGYPLHCSVRWVSSGCGWEGAVVLRTDGGSNVNHDAVDVTLKLCSLTKIMFDTDAYYPDNKIKFDLFKYPLNFMESRTSG
jgi:hypothetical protein